MAKKKAKAPAKKTPAKAQTKMPATKKPVKAAKKLPSKPKPKPEVKAKTAKLDKTSPPAKKAASKPPPPPVIPAAVAEPRTLLCRLDHTSPGWVAMSWEDSKTKKTWKYMIDREPLRRIAKEIRGEPDEDAPPGKLEALESLSGRFKAEGEDVSAALYALARAGAELHKAALGELGRKNPKTDPKPFREWFNANVLNAAPGAWRIVMIHKSLDTEVVVPWGLAFALRKDRDGEDERIEEMEPTSDGMSGFWCMKYAASVVGANYMPGNQQMQLKASQTKVGIVIEVGDYALDAHSHADLSYSLEDLGYVIDNRDKLRKHAYAFRQQNNFFYVSLNAEGGVYQLTDGPFEGGDLVRETQRIEQGHMVFAMLDGDCVIRGDRGKEWIEKLLMRSDRGVFAVETDVSNPQYRFFGWTFMRDALTAGDALIDGVAKARHKHWPRSLLYGLYCTPLQAAMVPPESFQQATKFVDQIIDRHVTALKQKAKS